MKRTRTNMVNNSSSVLLRRMKANADKIQTEERGSKVRVSRNHKKEAPDTTVITKAPSAVWKFEKVNSSIEFSAMYFKVVNVGGRFNNFDINVFSAADDFSDAVVELIIRVDSLDTGNIERDNLLKSEEWLNAKKYPTINFNSTSLKKQENKNYELIGNITIHGISHTITLEATLNGVFTNTYPKKTMAGFTVRGLFDRNKFEIGGEPGATGISYEIEIGANIEITKE